jgi:3,4-dihydroxy 2-butanone 4-phosphate synthase / GTP cyclohydrolase II
VIAGGEVDGIESVLSPAGRESRLARAEAQLIEGGIVVLCEPAAATHSKADLILAAGKATPAIVNLLITHGHSLLYVLMTAERCAKLGLEHLIDRDSERWISAMATSIEAKTGVTTGISAADRARTIRVAGDPGAVAGDLVQPGHVFPMAAERDGLMGRVGRTEAAVELLAFSGLFPVAAACELVNEEGETMSLAEAISFAERDQLPLVSVEDVLARRLGSVPMMLATQDVGLITSSTWGPLAQTVVTTLDGTCSHLLMSRAGDSLAEIRRAHVVGACPMGDIFDACDQGCGRRLRQAMADVAAGNGVVLVHLSPPGGHPKHPADPTLLAALAVPVMVAAGVPRGRAEDLAARESGASSIAEDRGA